MSRTGVAIKLQHLYSTQRVHKCYFDTCRCIYNPSLLPAVNLTSAFVTWKQVTNTAPKGLWHSLKILTTPSQFFFFFKLLSLSTPKLNKQKERFLCRQILGIFIFSILPYLRVCDSVTKYVWSVPFMQCKEIIN